MPDASVDATLNTLVAAGFGAAGQKCMALSTVVFVGGLNRWYFVLPLLLIFMLLDLLIFLRFFGGGRRTKLYPLPPTTQFVMFLRTFKSCN